MDRLTKIAGTPVALAEAMKVRRIAGLAFNCAAQLLDRFPQAMRIGRQRTVRGDGRWCPYIVAHGRRNVRLPLPSQETLEEIRRAGALILEYVQRLSRLAYNVLAKGREIGPVAQVIPRACD